MCLRGYEMETSKQIFEVDPKRLDRGKWCHTRNRQLGEGDISASYSADRIGEAGTVRKPFRHQGAEWVAIGVSPKSTRAYSLVHPSLFEGKTYSYAERVRDGYAGRCAKEGFYHGIRVSRARSELILCGPEAQFIEGEPEQGTLF